MKKARIAELKDRLSHYLRLVRQGQSVLVYDRERLVARIEPVRDPASVGDDHLAQLEATGVVRPPVTPLPKDWLRRRPVVKTDLLAALLDERESGR